MKKIFILLFSLLMIFGCGESEKPATKGQKRIDPHKPMAWGHKHVIYVVADDAIWKKAEPQLRRTLERYVFTTENEKFFEVKRAEYKDLDLYYKFNNLIFLGDLKDNTPVNEYIKGIISDKIKQQVKENQVGIYPLENLWANDQYVLFMLGADREKLLKLNYLVLNKTFELFRTKMLERVKRTLYLPEQHKKYEFSEYSWTLDLPLKYRLYRKDMNNNFISYIARLKEKADRYIAVYYEDSETDIVDKDWLIDKRAELAWKYYDEDEYAPDKMRTEKAEIAGHKGWKISGMWINKKYTVGGAYQAFAFYDERTKRAYLIDNSVYFPEGYKLDALIELEVISNTLKIK